MLIWIDADACPVVVRDITIKAAIRLKVKIVFVANKKILLPVSDLIEQVVVTEGPDKADEYIIENARPGDLVVSQDIPLSYSLVKAKIVVIDPRGRVHTEDNISERLATRDLLQELRDIGDVKGGPQAFGSKEKQAFAASFDRELSKLVRSSNA